VVTKSLKNIVDYPSCGPLGLALNQPKTLMVFVVLRLCTSVPETVVTPHIPQGRQPSTWGAVQKPPSSEWHVEEVRNFKTQVQLYFRDLGGI